MTDKGLRDLSRSTVDNFLDPNQSKIIAGNNHLMGDSASETKFKEDQQHLVLPVATPLPHHGHNIKSGYQHDVLNSGLHGGSSDGVVNGVNGGLDKYGADMSSLHLHNRFLMANPAAAAAATDPLKAADMHQFTTNPFSINRFLPGGHLTDPKDMPHYDYGQISSAGQVGAGQFGGHHGHESMYYPPPLYPVHHTPTSSVHSNHL